MELFIWLLNSLKLPEIQNHLQNYLASENIPDILCIIIEIVWSLRSGNNPKEIINVLLTPEILTCEA